MTTTEQTVQFSRVQPGYWKGEEEPPVGGLAVLMDDGGYRYTSTRPYGIPAEFVYRIVEDAPSEPGDDAFEDLLRQMADLTWMPLDARERFDAMLRVSFPSLTDDEEVA